MELSDKKKHFWLYVLLLEEQKYYIGITSKTPEVRFKQHLSGFAGAKWTKKYKPLKIIDTKDLGKMTFEDAESYEKKVIRKYMKQKGYNNARGGDLTSEDDYKKFFGYLFEVRDWDAIKTVMVLTLLMTMIFAMYLFERYY